MQTNSESFENFLRVKPEKEGAVNASVISRARSARKLKKMTASPSRTGPHGSPFGSRTADGMTNSSPTPSLYDFSRISFAERSPDFDEPVRMSYAFSTRSHRLSLSIAK